jgi:two-component system sensor histidine kinase/response regulator
MNEIGKHTFEKLVNFSTDLICILDKNANITFESKAVESMLGYRQGERIGFSIFDFIHPDDLSIVQTKVPKRYKEEAACQYRLKKKDGAYLWVDSKAISLFEDEDIRGILVSIRETEARHALEEKLKQSKNHFKNLFQRNKLPQILVDPKTLKILNLNEAALRFYSYSREELVGQTINRIHNLSIHDIRKRIGQVMRDGHGFFEFEQQTKNGELLKVHAFPSLINENGTKLIMASIVDVSAEERAKEALISSRQKFKTMNSILTQMLASNGVDLGYDYLVNQMRNFYDGAIVLYLSINEKNKSICLRTYAGLDEDTLTKAFSVLKTSLLNEEFEMPESVYLALKTNKLIKLEFDLYQLSNGMFPKNISKVLLQAIGAKEIYTIGVNQGDKLMGAYHFINIHSDMPPDKELIELFARQVGVFLERRSMLEELALQEKELVELNQSKDKLFSIISHDLRTPYNAILGFSQLALDEVAEKEYSNVHSYLEIINQSMTQSFNILNNLLNWSRLQNGKLTYKAGRFILRDVLDQAAKMLEPNMKSKAIKLHTHMDNSELEVETDSYMLDTILRNLISNAIKFSHENSIIQLRVKQYQDFIRISVEDEGIGMSPSDVHSIMNHSLGFSKVGTKNEQGTGLGIALCYDMVHKMNSQLHVQSTPGEGTTFYFDIKTINHEA